MKPVSETHEKKRERQGLLRATATAAAAAAAAAVRI